MLLSAVSIYAMKNMPFFNQTIDLSELDKEEVLALNEMVSVKDESIELKIEDVQIIEIEEEVVLEFDVNQYLPENFNPYLGMNNLQELEIEATIALQQIITSDEDLIELTVEDIVVIELEEDLEIEFDTAPFLPKGFNPYKGIGNLLENEVVALSQAYQQLTIIKESVH